MNVLTRLHRLFTKEREIRMIWEVEKGDRTSFLVGTSHFFPYRFTDSLRRHIGSAHTVLLEGPLDERAMRAVVESGTGKGSHPSLYDALDAPTIEKIGAALAEPTAPASASRLYWDILGGGPQDSLRSEIGGLKPWMAFYHIWTHYRTRDGWVYTMDLDAANIAREMGKEVRFLERIEEQIEALNRIPLERIVGFLKNVDWYRYRRDFVRHYLAGDLERLMATASVFPTFCEPIIDRRDPVLHDRMGPFLEKGNAIAFVGITHCRGIISRLRAQRYAVKAATGH
ncbi:MAG: TraB/GumN family protein [Betaproteobacteria bacterium]|nr:TraB/GumN family protein [Betaproteobacteria bacterium]